MLRCELNKMHFRMGVLLYIKFAACMPASDTGYLAHFLVAFKMESICMSWKLKERQKNFHKSFHDVCEKGGVGVEKKRHIT